MTEIRVAGTSSGNDGRGRWMTRTGWTAGLATFGAVALTGCINVSAPEEPIVIELNVNIRAEVLYRLAEDASNTIDENADIF
ncbi:MAG: YnbE family lipoprotein [Erythrobacter sp.]